MAATLKALAIARRRGPPRQPWRNGRIERLFGTLKCAIGKVRFGCADGLQAKLNSFRAFYNVIRPHQALAGLTPEEVWQGKTLPRCSKPLRTAKDDASRHWTASWWGITCEGSGTAVGLSPKRRFTVSAAAEERARSPWKSCLKIRQKPRVPFDDGSSKPAQR